jgi:putative DNA primase/helicase
MPDEKAVLDMPERLRAEYNGIFRWLIEGCLEWQNIGLLEPESVKVATDKYRLEQNHLQNFLDEVTVPNDKIRARALYRAYRKWSEDVGETPISEVGFADKMDGLGYSRVRSGGMWYLNISIPQQFVTDGGSEFVDDLTPRDRYHTG